MQELRFRYDVDAPIVRDASSEYVSELTEHCLIGGSRWTQTARLLVAVHAAHDKPVILEGSGERERDSSPD